MVSVLWVNGCTIDFLLLLFLHHESLIETVLKVSRLCPDDVSVDKVIALLGNQPPEEMSPETQSEKKDEIEDLSMQQLQEISQLVGSGIN